MAAAPVAGGFVIVYADQDAGRRRNPFLVQGCSRQGCDHADRYPGPISAPEEIIDWSQLLSGGVEPVVAVGLECAFGSAAVHVVGEGARCTDIVPVDGDVDLAM